MMGELLKNIVNMTRSYSLSRTLFDTINSIYLPKVARQGFTAARIRFNKCDNPIMLEKYLIGYYIDITLQFYNEEDAYYSIDVNYHKSTWTDEEIALIIEYFLKEYDYEGFDITDSLESNEVAISWRDAYEQRYSETDNTEVEEYSDNPAKNEIRKQLQSIL